MKKSKIFHLLLLVGITFNNQLKSQSNSQSDNCVKEGTFIIDGFYGYPYYIGKYISDVNKNNSSNNYTNVKNLNHIGGKCEYMINKVVGLGVEYTYASVKAKYDETSSVWNGSSYQDETNIYNVSIVKQRILAKVNIHFATSKYIDPYATAGIGFKTVFAKSDNPSDQNNIRDLNNFLNVVPLSFRFGIGVRYYFIKNLGVGIEAGIGGPLIQGGLSLKF